MNIRRRVVLILLVLFLDEFFFGVVTRYPVDFGERRHFELVFCVAFKEVFFICKDLIDFIANKPVELFDKCMLFVVFLDTISHQGVEVVNDRLIHFQLILSLVELLLCVVHFDWIEVPHPVLSVVPLQLLIDFDFLVFDSVMILPS